MRCAACDCRENENGYCGCPSYVCIDENGQCDSYYVPAKDPDAFHRQLKRFDIKPPRKSGVY